jgi:hypothetical protein
MTEEQIVRHLSNPWLSPAETARLRGNIEKLITLWKAHNEIS